MSDIYAPVVENQRWNNEFGSIDSFSRPQQSVVTNSLLRGALGFGAGAAGGGIAHKNPWLTGGHTATGSVLGYLVSHLLAGNASPENRAMYENLGTLAGTGAGMAGSLLNKKKQKQEVTIPLPRLDVSIKTASLNDILREAYYQLPNIRLPDSVVGGALGAGGGLLYDHLQQDGAKKPNSKKTLSRVLGGAGIGALGGNIAGDRARRYVSNNITPYTYDLENSKVNTLAPKGIKHIFDSAILDKPQQAPVQEYLAGKYDAPHTAYPGAVNDATKANFASRWELFRRGMDLPIRQGDKSIWKQQPDNSLSLNPAHPNADNLVTELMYPAGKMTPGNPRNDLISGAIQSEFIQDPLKSVAKINSSGAKGDRLGLMSDIVGGQRVSSYPLDRQDLGNDYLLKQQDRWGLGPKSHEEQDMKNFLYNKFIKLNPDAKLNSTQGYSSPGILNYLKRVAAEKVLFREAPWVSQRMYMQKNTDNPGYTSIPTTASGEVYPNNIGYFNPETLGMEEGGLQKLTPR